MPDKNLDDIFIDESDIEESVLAEAIDPFGKLVEQSGSFLPTDEFHELAEGQKVLVGLLAHHAKYLKGLEEEPGIGPRDLSDFTGVNNNTVKVNLRNFDEMGLVSSEDGDYQVSTIQLTKVRDELLEE